VLFEFSYHLCKEYPALSPWEIDGKKFRDVIKLFAETRTVQIRSNQEKPERNDRVIRRKAGDNWF